MAFSVPKKYGNSRLPQSRRGICCCCAHHSVWIWPKRRRTRNAMTSIIKFRPLSGGMMPTHSALSPPHAYLLELDQFTFLCDCGWNAQFDMAFMHELKAVVHKVIKPPSQLNIWNGAGLAMSMNRSRGRHPDIIYIARVRICLKGP